MKNTICLEKLQKFMSKSLLRHSLLLLCSSLLRKLLDLKSIKTFSLSFIIIISPNMSIYHLRMESVQEQPFLNGVGLGEAWQVDLKLVKAD
jgi:TFIIF-interacting CTD phosphatase-like protein